jgi:hypothetical protein
MMGQKTKLITADGVELQAIILAKTYEFAIVEIVECEDENLNGTILRIDIEQVN